MLADAALTILLLVAVAPTQASSPQALPSWVAQAVVDPATEDEVAGVATRNSEGFRLELLRTADGAVLGVFRLPPGAGDFLSSSLVPSLAIDRAPFQQVWKIDQGLTWISFPTWNGAGQALTGLLRELMSGRELRVTYPLEGGGYKDTGFALAGAREAIAAAFGVPSEVDPEQVAASIELEEALRVEADRCLRLTGKKRQGCIDTVKACAATSATAEALRECLEAR